MAQLQYFFTLDVTVSDTRCGLLAKHCEFEEKRNGSALHRSNAEGERDWGFSRVRKDTKVYQEASGDFGRGHEGVRSSLSGDDWEEGSVAYRSCF